MKNRNTVWDLVKNVGKCGLETLRFFFYPSFCLHCKRSAEPDRLLCRDCSSLIDWADPIDPRRAAVLAPFGPALSLIPRFDAPDEERIADLIAALAVIRIDRIGWDVPCCIVPVPSPPFNRSFANALAALLAVPAIDALQRKSLLFEKGFRWDFAKIPEEKNILVIDLFLRDLELFAPCEAERRVFFLSVFPGRP